MYADNWWDEPEYHSVDSQSDELDSEDNYIPEKRLRCNERLVLSIQPNSLKNMAGAVFLMSEDFDFLYFNCFTRYAKSLRRAINDMMSDEIYTMVVNARRSPYLVGVFHSETTTWNAIVLYAKDCKLAESSKIIRIVLTQNCDFIPMIIQS